MLQTEQDKTDRQIYRTDRQRSDSIGRIVLQTVAQKRDNWRPGQDYDGTRDRGARKRDVPAKTGRVATLY